MLFAIAVILLLIIDQALKYWVTLSIPLDEGVRALFPGVVELRNIHNTGAAFSLFADAPRWVFIILAVVFVIIVVVALRRRWVSGAFGRWMAILLLAGALGNLLDRMLSGYVVDMFAFEFWPSFPVFNFADVCLVIGGIGFFLYALLHKEPEEKKPAAKAKAKAKSAQPRPEREPDVKEARPTEKKPAPAPVPKEQPTQKIKAAQPKPEAAKQEAPKPAPAKQEAPKQEVPKPAQPKAEPEKPAAQEDPFAAWDKAVQSMEKEAEVQAAEAAKPAPPPEPKPSDVKPTVPRRPKPAESFTLDDILAEFKDE